jgi:hypothetical protein
METKTSSNKPKVEDLRIMKRKDAKVLIEQDLELAIAVIDDRVLRLRRRNELAVHAVVSYKAAATYVFDNKKLPSNTRISLLQTGAIFHKELALRILTDPETYRKKNALGWTLAGVAALQDIDAAIYASKHPEILELKDTDGRSVEDSISTILIDSRPISFAANAEPSKILELRGLLRLDVRPRYVEQLLHKARIFTG